jgi:dipeptidyl aminopeptidase/acylaminoacyl peptidase
VKRPFSFEDFWNLAQVSDVHPSPVDSRVAYVVTTFDQAKGSHKSAIWVGDTQTGETRQFSSGDDLDFQPAWSAGGDRIAFVSTRHENKPQIYVAEVGGGEARRLSEAVEGATTPLWSPDGKRICYSSAIRSGEQSVPAETAWRAAHPDAPSTLPEMRKQSTLWWRMDGRGFVDARIQLFLIDSEGKGEPVSLTSGQFDHVSPAWSPDGTVIAFAANRQAEREFSMGSDLWTVNVETREIRRLTDETLACAAPAWSADGRSIAFFATPDARGCGYHPLHLWVTSVEGGDARDVTPNIDTTCFPTLPDHVIPPLAPPCWSPDGESILFIAADHGDAPIFRVSLATGIVDRVSGDGWSCYSVGVDAETGSLAGLGATPAHPFDVFVLTPGAALPVFPFLTNKQLLDEVALNAPERLRWTGDDGWEIEGWLIRPDLANGADAPLIVEVHGGPHHMLGNTFYFQKQALAGSGYAVLFTNPRGSNGYGDAFAAAADWGQKDFRDIMGGVNAAITSGGIDHRRMGITGISYGGFMTNWAIGHSRRFRGAVSVNGVSNFISFFGVSDIGPLWFTREFPQDFGSPFWTDQAIMRRYRHAPLTNPERERLSLSH